MKYARKVSIKFTITHKRIKMICKIYRGKLQKKIGGADSITECNFINQFNLFDLAPEFLVQIFSRL